MHTEANLDVTPRFSQFQKVVGDKHQGVFDEKRLPTLVIQEATNRPHIPSKEKFQRGILKGLRNIHDTL